MAAINFQDVRFVKSATKEVQWPLQKSDQGMLLPEIAVAGRSNVGKSSLLNDLFATKKLVKTSSTPGKTQLLNFFSVHNRVSICDLPGYGYAQVPLSVRKQWGPMMQEYLTKRKELKLVLLLLDIRRDPSVEDRQFVDWIKSVGLELLVILTKIDKVTRGELVKQTEVIMKELFAEKFTEQKFLHYSTVKGGVGPICLRSQLQNYLNP